MAGKHGGCTSRGPTDASVEIQTEAGNLRSSSLILNVHALCAAIYMPHRITIFNTLPAAKDEAVAEPSQSTIRISPKHRYRYLPNKETILCPPEMVGRKLERQKGRYKATGSKW
jgi:hypothetical protein